MGFWGLLYSGLLENLFGEPILFGLILLTIFTVAIFSAGIVRIFSIGLVFAVALGLLQFGLIPMPIFAGLLLLFGIGFVIIIFKLIFGGGY